MKETTSNKKNHVILTILSILVVILLIAVYLQGEKLSKFIEGLGEKPQTEIKAGGSSLEKSTSQDDEEQYQKKIQNLETRITDMQEKQDQLEDTLSEYGDKEASIVSEMDAVSKVREDFNRRKNLTNMYKDFLNQNNYPPELSEKLVDLYFERHNKLGEHNMKVPEDWENPEDWSKNKEFNRQTEEINAIYDEKVAELLPEGGLAAYKKYEAKIKEKDLVNYFQSTLGDEALEKKKARELIDLLYKDAQPYNIQDENYKNIPFVMPYVIPEKKLDEETIDRIVAENDENLRKTYETYLESAKGILSDSEMVKFEGFINFLKKLYLEDNATENSSEKEVGEE